MPGLWPLRARCLLPGCEPVEPGEWNSESASKNQLYHEIIGAAGQPNANPEIELPVRRKVQVERREDLVLLLFPIVEVAGRAEGAVILHPDGNELRDVETDFGAGSEIEAGGGVQAMDGFLEAG